MTKKTKVECEKELMEIQLRILYAPFTKEDVSQARHLRDSINEFELLDIDIVSELVEL